MEFYSVIHPDYKETLRLRQTEDSKYERYYAFPAILKKDENTLLITHKNGTQHWNDGKEGLVTQDQITFDIPSQTVKNIKPIFADGKIIPQMGEYVKMPNGDICVYFDTQYADHAPDRTGMYMVRSKDGGKTYSVPEKTGMIDGVEYGYPFDYCEKNGRVFLLVMTFERLTGSGNSRGVHLISSADNGCTWRFEANFTRLLGREFNESSIVALDNGFALFTRGEAPRYLKNRGADTEASNCLSVFDDDFKLLRVRDYHATRNDFSLTGRPRIYEYKGKLLLITRQNIPTAEGTRMVLDLFALDVQTLELTARFRLDDPVADKQDGHYASLYFDDQNGRNMLRVIDYVTCPTTYNPTVTRKPDIVQYSFDLDRMARQFKGATGYDF